MGQRQAQKVRIGFHSRSRLRGRRSAPRCSLKNPDSWRRIKYSSHPAEVTCMAATLEAVRVGKQNLFLPEGPFRNEPFTDFSRPENARAMRAALAKVHSELGREYPLIIGGESI